MEILEGINDAQKEAVLTTSGPLLILAGAGSGKTKTLTHRIAYLIQHEGIWPNEILAVTFTNKAAREMRERLGLLLGQDGSSRVFMGWMGTFHGICVKLLRMDGAAIGIASNYVIYDEDDRLGLIKQAMKQLKLSDKQIKPRAVSSAISEAKNKLQTPEDYLAAAHYPFLQQVASIYEHYEQSRKQAGALDFDDLLIETVRLFRERPEVRAKWRAQFKHILIDEYQDTNAAQYAIVKSLVGDDQNICVVGDDWQCYTPDTIVDTADGPRTIDTVSEGDRVLASAGFGRLEYFPVQRTHHFSYRGKLVHITTKRGKKIRCTPNHILFSHLNGISQYFVYLMYSGTYGYRIGIAQGTRYDGKKHDVGLRIHVNQERADKVWVLRLCDSRSDAQYYEALYAYQYGMPMTRFRSGTQNGFTQETIDKLFRSIDTMANAKHLADDLGISLDYPHFVPQATIRNGHKSVHANVVLFGDRRVSQASAWSASRLSVNTTDGDVRRLFEDMGLRPRAGKGADWRVELHNLDYAKIESVIEQIEKLDGGGAASKLDICKYAYITNSKYMFMPAAHLHPGMSIPTVVDGSVVDDMIVAVERREYDGEVYDIDVDKVHNYAASGVIGHNSIYSWRGADFTNILNFERDYPGTKVIKLEQNYRSTGAILDAAHSVITKNVERTDKKLWTAEGAGMPVQVHQAYDENEEAYMVASRIESQTSMGARQYHDFAVLYRTNAMSYTIERALLQQRVPYQIVGGVRFYDRKEIKDIIAYMRLVYQPSDLMSFSRIVNVPARGIGEKSLEKFMLWQSNSGMDILAALVNAREATGILPRMQASLVSLGETLRVVQAKVLSDTSPSEIIDYLLKSTGYRDYILDGTPQAEDREANIGSLISDAKAFATMPDFLEEVALMSSADQSSGKQKVTLMTLHAAKGLEFPVVFMVGMEEGIFPHSRVYEAGPSELEEERRLCYVGMTRAREELHLSHASSRLQFGARGYNQPSRFLADMGHNIFAAAAPTPRPSTRKNDEYDYCDIPDFDIGDRVKSAQFGVGEIIDIDGLAVTVEFDDGRTKKLNVEYAKLDKMS